MTPRGLTLKAASLPQLLLKSRLARAGALMSLGNVLAGGLGYIFQVAMGRMLSVSDYALFSALMAVVAMFAAPLGTLTMVVARKASEYRARGSESSLPLFYSAVLTKGSIGCLAVLLALALFMPTIEQYLHSTLLPVVMLFVLILVSFALAVNNGVLQGGQRFVFLSVSGAAAVLLKIFFASALVLFGGGVEGAVTGVALSVGLVFLAGYSALRPSTRTRAASRFEFNRSHLKAVIPVLVANIAFAAMTQMDIVLVNYFFDREAAGSFAAAATLGKAILYLPGGIALALFPMVAERSARSERALGLLVQAVGMVFALCLAGAVFYLVVGEPLMTALFGTRYAGAGAILRYYGFAILPMTLLMVVEYFLIAKGKVFFAYLFLIGAPLQIATVCFFHKTLLSVIVIMGSFGVGLLLIGGVALYGSVRRDRLYSA